MIEIKQLKTKAKSTDLVCYHCGDPCPHSEIYHGEKVFCCAGCKLVYEILEAHDLCTYYDLGQNPGISPQESGRQKKYAYLDDEDLKNRLLSYHDGRISKINLFIPAMHCSSCIWLLENLYRLNPGLRESQVDFLKKELTITFNNSETTLREIVELLVSIGYEPQISLESTEQKRKRATSKDLYLKIGVAGFCFSNIMLFSFPDYLSFGKGIGPTFEKFFGYMNIFMALPVFLYSSSDYFRSAFNGWRQKMVNMDVPISLGIATLFLRSLYDILSGSGSGFMDSFTGLVFLLLIGKLFEKKTYDTLSFERDYKSYFPIAVTKKDRMGEQTIPLEKLKVGDRLVIRNEELIPADSIMINGEAFIDYSFVSGESTPQIKVSGEMIYAGGKQIGSAIELDVIKDVSQSYLTQLWNEETFQKEQQSKITTLANSISRYFTIAVISIALLAAIYWSLSDFSFALNAFTAVLIVACPCALALSTPFTLGNTLRIFGKNKFYLKNISVIEALAKIDTIVFDKTGTITRGKAAQVEFNALDPHLGDLNEAEKVMIASLSRQSNHPLSQQIYAQLSDKPFKPVREFKEITGQGLSGIIDNTRVRIGSEEFISGRSNQNQMVQTSSVFVEVAGKIKGFFSITNQYRSGLKETVAQLKKFFRLFVVTGDNENEKSNLLNYFSDESTLYFRRSPFQKLDFIRKLQNAHKRVLMIGDGLNDAGALKQSDVGISITEDVNTFAPSSDAILDGQQFHRLADFVIFAQQSMTIIIISFIISFIYNLVGLSFAISGTLSPLIAAILMPISSISVIVFSTGTTTLLAKKKGMWNGSR